MQLHILIKSNIDTVRGYGKKDRILELNHFEISDMLKYLNKEMYKINPKRINEGIYKVYGDTDISTGTKLSPIRIHYLIFHYQLKNLKKMTNGVIKTWDDYAENYEEYIRPLEYKYEKIHLIQDVKNYLIKRCNERIVCGHDLELDYGCKFNNVFDKLNIEELNKLYNVLYHQNYEKTFLQDKKTFLKLKKTYVRERKITQKSPAFILK